MKKMILNVVVLLFIFSSLVGCEKSASVPDDSSPTTSQANENKNINDVATTTPETGSKNVLISETTDEKGFFWIGMTEQQAIDAINVNGMIIDKVDGVQYDDLGVETVTQDSDKEKGVYYRITTTGFLILDFNKDKELLYFTAQYPPQTSQGEAAKLSITYTTEKGLKLMDSFDKVQELYGTPDKSSDETGPTVYTYKLNDNLYLFVRGTISSNINQIDLFEYSSTDSMFY